ncbi:hypothetical protein [Herbiconiux solani]|uniref:hypothetical protein n=1 Tax=Herbiconiux solani TaxID=661329 RepID=UPI000824AF1D|nr:hypothetical protein [Herbiconiux solani]
MAAHAAARAEPEARASEVHTDSGDDLSPLEAEVIALLLPRLRARLGHGVAESAETIAERMIATIPVVDRWQDLIGPFYTATDVAAWRGVTRQQVHKLRKTGALLGPQTTDGRVVFPAWQFGLHGEGLPRLREVKAALGPAAPDDWARALWLNAATPRFGGSSAADLLKSGRSDEVLEAAWSDAADIDIAAAAAATKTAAAAATEADAAADG